ncbi:MAG: radical SAM protein [Elusimicrobiota bacterium]
MCYAIPGKLVSVNKNVGIVEYFGEKRKVLLDYSDVVPGDYIYAQGGVCVNKVPEEEALQALEAWKEVFFDLQKKDELLSSPRVKKKGEVFDIVQNINRGLEISGSQVKRLLLAEDKDEISLICGAANSIRQRVNKNACCVHGIIEFSNYCENSCHYCGIRKERDIERYRMTPDEIEEAAFEAMDKHGFRAFVLQSGEDSYYDAQMLAGVVRRIRNRGALVFLSLGTRSEDFYNKLYESGARAALLRFETGNKELFRSLRPGTSFNRRLERIRFLKKKGFVTATGFLAGLPGEKPDDVLNNINLAGTLGADMISFGPVVPAPRTPLEDIEMPSHEDILKIVALTRILYPKSKILVTSAMEKLYKDMPESGLLAGGNSLMIDVTPEHYRKKYIIYPGKEGSGDSIEDIIKQKTRLLYSLGRAPTDLGIN